MSLHEWSTALAGVVKANEGSVVRVETDCRGGGSGIAWTDKLIVTAAHLVPEAASEDRTIAVGLPDGNRVAARLLGRDDGTDLAVLALDGVSLAAPRWAEAETLEVGHLTLSLARPGRVARAALGMIAAMGEGFGTRSGGRIERWIELDGGLPQGFSGAAVCTVDHVVVGLGTPMLVRGAPLVVPTTTIRRVVEELVAHGGVRRGYLGVGVYPVQFPPALAGQLGQRAAVIVVAVEPQGPAERAGIVLGDILLSIDGAEVAGARELTHLLSTKLDVEARARILRSGKVVELPVHTATKH